MALQASMVCSSWQLRFAVLKKTLVPSCRKATDSAQIVNEVNKSTIWPELISSRLRHSVHWVGSLIHENSFSIGGNSLDSTTSCVLSNTNQHNQSLDAINAQLARLRTVIAQLNNKCSCRAELQILVNIAGKVFLANYRRTDFCQPLKF